GLPGALHPFWSVDSAAQFWGEISRLLANGALGDGRRRLCAEALKQFPANEVFGVGARAAMAPVRLVSSWQAARAGWPLPDPFVGRDAVVSEVRNLLVSAGADPVGVVGMGGAGKSTVARAVVHDDTVRDRFPDGVVWVEVNPDADVTVAQSRVLTA